NQRFGEVPFHDQALHLAAVAFVAVSAALVMTPAAFHREVEPKAVSERLLTVSTWLLLAGMALLALGMAADFFIIAAFIFQSRIGPAIFAAVLLVAIASLWFIFPCWQRWKAK